MDSKELVRMLRKQAKCQGVAFAIDKRRGKGSHQTVTFGDRRAVIPMTSKELKAGTLAHILKVLGVALP